MIYVVVLFIALLLTILFVRGNIKHRRLVENSEAIHHRVYHAFSPTPLLNVSYSYGYPAFEVIFSSKAELQAAADADLNSSFRQEIGVLCKDQGSKNYPFNAEQGVNFTYEGWLEEQLAQDKKAIPMEHHDT